MSGILATLTEALQDRFEKKRNRPFLEGIMAACAVIATADGKVSFPEQVRVDQILQTLDRLKVFDPHVGVDLFKDYAQDILDNPKDGHRRAISAVDAVAIDAKDGALLLRVCIAVSEADGNISLTEQIEIVSLCSRFGIDPSACGLYIDLPMDEFLATKVDRSAG